MMNSIYSDVLHWSCRQLWFASIFLSRKIKYRQDFFFIFSFLLIIGMLVTTEKIVYAQAWNEGYYLFLDIHPEQATPLWGNDDNHTNGIAHDNDNWYICTNGTKSLSDFEIPGSDPTKYRFWRIPVEIDINVTINSVKDYFNIPDGIVTRDRGDIPQLNASEFTHVGDIDCINVDNRTYVLVPMYLSYKSCIVVLRGEDLTYAGHTILDGIGHIGWCAYRRYNNKDYIYTSEHETDVIFAYKIDKDRLVKNQINTLHSPERYRLRTEDDNRLFIYSFQGGEFSPSGELLYVSSGVSLQRHETDGVHVFEQNNWEWREVARSVNQTRGESGCFDYTFDPTFDPIQEPEGLTVWNLDDGRAPNIRGQLHVLNYNWNIVHTNRVNLFHYGNTKGIVNTFPPNPIEPLGCGAISGNLRWEFPLGSEPCMYRVQFANNEMNIIGDKEVHNTNHCGYRALYGRKYHWRVRVEAQLHSDHNDCYDCKSAFSPWTSFTTPPSAPGIPEDDGTYTISRDVSFNWTPVIASESCDINYKLQVGTTPGGNDIFDDWIGNVLTKTVSGNAGQTLYARVQAKTGAECVGEWSESSDGITILFVDVLFIFNLANSMNDGLTEIKSTALSLIDDLISINSDVMYGVASFVDYVGSYSSCDYSQLYGDEQMGDFNWKINHQLSNDDLLIKKSISSLNTFSGGDKAQNYSLALLNSLFLNWRPESRKFLIICGDSPAHDCDFFSCSYGADPGIDQELNTYDDLDYEKVVKWVDLSGLTIISLDGSAGTGPSLDYDGDCWKNFEYMALTTGGQHFLKENWNDIPSELINCGSLSPKSVNIYPWTLEAEEMMNRLPWYGNPCEGGWRITHEHQPIYRPLIFLNEGVYHFTIRAKAEIANGKPPWLKVEVGNEYSGTCEILSTEWKNYSFSAVLPKGYHCLRLIFLNNWYHPKKGDRNLLIDKVVINSQEETLEVTFFKIEAEEMHRHNHTRLDSSGELVVFDKYYSQITHSLFLEQPELDFEIFAMADSSTSGWPVMEFWFDNQVKYLTFNTTAPLSVKYTLSGIAPGEHHLKFQFKKGTWNNARKLYLDKLIVFNMEGGLLKTDFDKSSKGENDFITIPKKFAVHKNYPNPFNLYTNIRYELPEEAYVTIKIFNTLGHEIRTLVTENRPAGSYNIQWDGRDEQGNQVVSGLYFYRIQAGKFNDALKMLLMK